MTERNTYRKVADALRQRVRSGELKPGDMLPSELSLASDFAVARGTARAALILLEEDGIAEVVQGVGRRVAGAPRGSGAPNTAYETVAAAVRSGIETGSYGADTALPSEAEFMAEFGVSRNTVRRAYALLVDEGTVVVRQGAGAFVAPTGKHR